MATKTTKNALVNTGRTAKVETFADRITEFAKATASNDADLQRKARDASRTASAFTKDSDAERTKLTSLIDGWRNGSTDGTASELAEHHANIERLGYLIEGATAKANQANQGASEHR